MALFDFNHTTTQVLVLPMSQIKYLSFTECDVRSPGDVGFLLQAAGVGNYFLGVF